MVRGKKVHTDLERHMCTTCRSRYVVESPCDYCLLEQYGLSGKAKYDSLDHFAEEELYPQELVLKALRQAISDGKEQHAKRRGSVKAGRGGR